MISRNVISFFGLVLLAGHLFAQKTDIALTVYNNNLALVKDSRTLTLKKGANTVEIQDVAAQIDPTSVYFSPENLSGAVTILEQNYEYDLISQDKILQKYIDHDIRLETKDGTTYTGKLLSFSGGGVVLQDKDNGIKMISRATVENISFPKLPEGFISKPTLVWQLSCSKAGAYPTEIGYLTSGIQWHAEYVGVIDEKDSQLQLSAWVSIDNKSGATYKNAKLKLVAGEVHRAEREKPLMYLQKAATEMTQAGRQQFGEKAFFEYHLYTLKRPADVANNQIKQISLFPSTQTTVTKTYSYFAARDAKHVRVYLDFKNEKKSGLGVPLPKGKIRLYKRDSDGGLIFIGEDFIKHTPKNEPVKVNVGNAFDIVAERKQKDRRSLGKQSWQESWEITLRNHKKAGVHVAVTERLQPNWEIVKHSHEFTRRDSQTIEFKVPVPADGETVVAYTVRYAR